MVILRLNLAGVEGEQKTDIAHDEIRAWAIDDVLDAALTVTGAEVAEVHLREPDEAAVSLAGHRGPFSEEFQQITRFEEGQGFPGLVVGEGLPLRADDAAHDPRFLRTQVKDLGFRYFLCVPVPGPDRPIGSLGVATRTGSDALFAQCVTLSRAAERLALILEREESAHHVAGLAPVADHDPDSKRRLDLRALGYFSARRGGTPLSIDSFARRRAVTLLKILLTNYGKTVLRDELVELLWPSSPPKDAAKLLKIAVHYLRRGLGESENGKTESSFILTEAHGYAFNPASFHSLDVFDFESLADEGLRFERQGRWREATATLRAAADLYRGDYLEDDRYSDWCLARRRQLKEKLFQVLLTTARLQRNAGDTEAAIRTYRRILELDPCLEDVHRDLMELLSRSGRRSQALRQFEACRQALKDEFDAAPEIETETLYRSILGSLSG